MSVRNMLLFVPFYRQIGTELHTNEKVQKQLEKLHEIVDQIIRENSEVFVKTRISFRTVQVYVKVLHSEWL